MTLPTLPSIFIVLEPHQPFGDAARSIEHAVGVIFALLQHCKDNEISYVEPRQQAVGEWREHVVDGSKGALSNDVDSWMTGVNTNIKGKDVRSVARYTGAAQESRGRGLECKKSGYKDLILS
ncbi:hypothetical protein B0J12DRAFT_699537 [Macrophomina phaseolina]|uniref:Uncharacterized protein n=1 Tax=Macrophomina phaseolina TaxID=35725 RepID=A0ABQ8GAM4_9PEZI|nr:hypothetical protein B0J12DRAFT_699537 [Macrophomina phaseolina]